MIDFKKYLASLCTALYAIVSLGAPVTFYHCSMGKQHITTIKCCSAKTQPGSNIAAPPCSFATNFGLPLKANVIPCAHKTATLKTVILYYAPPKAPPTSSLIEQRFLGTFRERLPHPLHLIQKLLV
jgi:hypothetical protein